MRLKSIKLAGFKSFVDPTTVHFPSNLCAVVGPNGCGKSNIIDAVRWVMGESSAKNLRGEQMTDVIFNGSTNRKPVGQAAVELVFDNSDHKIAGEYARFNEISVKRVVNADAQNSYYLNGTKCRRRDIADIFLGTGLGPRSYSIIEQGMVSKLIESKPEEMRVFIEEAAGISKYKERRRETENRIRRTKENLERLADIRDELERQLQHLQRQAKAAEKFREYKQEERDMTARLSALRWQSLDNEVTGGEREIRELEVSLEASNAAFRKCEAEIEQLRSDNSEVHDAYQEIQAQFYGLGGEISRLEQSIEHQKQRKQQLEEDLALIQDSLAQARGELAQDEERIASLTEELGLVEPELEESRAQEEESLQAQEAAEEVMAKWQHEWEEFNARSATVTRNAEVERQRIQHLENILERGQQRKQNLENERQGLSAGPEEEEIAQLEEGIADADGQREALEERNEAVGSRIEEVRRSLKSLNEELNGARSALQGLIGRRASLEALQQAALGQNGGAVLEWLKGQRLDANPRLVDGLKVDKGWERAAETVLGAHLQAVCVDALDGFAEPLAGLTEGELNLLETAPTEGLSANGTLAGRELQARIDSPQDLTSLLDGIYCAADLPEALALRAHLRGGESLITPEGIWLGRAWLRLAAGFDEKAGMIQRQEELARVGGAIAEQEAMAGELEERLEAEQQRLAALEREKEEFLQQLGAIGRRLTELSAERSAKLMKVEQVSERRKRLNHELSELERQLAVEKENLAASRQALESALDVMEQDTERREELLRSRDEFRNVLDASRQKARHDREHTHQLALRHQTLLAQLNSLQSAMERVAAQVRTYDLRHSQLKEHLRQADDPIPGLRQGLEEKLSMRVEVEARLNQAKARVDAIEHDLRALEQKRHQAQENSQKIRDLLVTRRLGIEGASVKREALIQTLTESGYELRAVLDGLPEEFSTESACAEELERLNARIQRLGPINLAAIDEYTAQSERKLYLDSQNDDLQKALLTLENAIRKIDKETRTRFKETFDKINQGLQELFPKVFGGGHAYLDMLGEDLLDTGVAIMARPPGKKNSTIHLLSGGEKAMTAIALVFSIFRLNPSPFCMLDEVDAPLDDANVGRYNRLVEEMAQVVQFIFITHNRITMEMAHQLLGVTMHEPGVSRLVAVDVDEAAELAAM